MTFRVIITDDAQTDLFNIYHWVVAEAGVEIADGYYGRIEARLFALDRYPNRGSPREDLGEGIRSVSFERRITILYRVETNIVRIMRIVSSARELGSAMQ